MYNFYCNYIKDKYGKLLFADTDSLIYEIETKSFMKTKKYLSSANILKIQNIIKRPDKIVNKKKKKTCVWTYKIFCRIKSKNLYLYNKRRT